MEEPDLGGQIPLFGFTGTACNLLVELIVTDWRGDVCMHQSRDVNRGA